MRRAARLETAVAGPGLAWVALQAVLLVGWAIGLRPFEATPPTTLAEMVALGDHASVVGAVRGGADPNQPSSIRAGLPLGPTEAITPIQTAVSTNQPGLLARLRDLGAVVHSQNYPELVCRARGMGSTELAAYVEGLLADQRPVSCPATRQP